MIATNHVGLRDNVEYTDAIWVYWTKNLNRWDAAHKAVVLDYLNCTSSKQIVVLPSTVQVGARLAIFYDGDRDSKSVGSMNRDVGLAWLDLPLVPPATATGERR